MDPAHRKYLSSINFMRRKHINVSDINVIGDRNIVDCGFFQFVKRTFDIRVCIKAVMCFIFRDVDDDFPPRNSLKIAGGILVGWSLIFVLFVLKTCIPDQFNSNGMSIALCGVALLKFVWSRSSLEKAIMTLHNCSRNRIC